MTRTLFHVLYSLAALSSVHAYFLVGVKDFITTQRLDPLVSPGKVASHAHSVLGGSNFGFEVTTEDLRNSECTSMPIEEDNSNYWFPHLYFQWNNGSFTSLSGGAVIYYLYDDQAGKTTAFPDNLRMLSGDMLLRTYDPNSYAQQAVTFLCLDFNGVTTRHNGLPLQSCPSGVRAQINFPSCWDGKNLDSADHKSHVAFRSGGPDTGDCSDPNFPVTLPRVFIEVYWNTELDAHRGDAMNTTQPYVFAYGDRTGYGYHADFINGWKSGVLQKVVDNCHCNEFGDPQCCADQGLFTLNKEGTCRITDSIDEQTLGTLSKLPGNNPVQEEGTRATAFTDPITPAIIAPVFAYTGDSPTQTGNIVSAASGNGATLVNVPSASAASVSGTPASASTADSTSVASGSEATGGSESVSSISAASGETASGSGSVPTSAASGSEATGGSEPASPTSVASGSEATGGSESISSTSAASGSEATGGSESVSSTSAASGSEATPVSGTESASNSAGNSSSGSQSSGSSGSNNSSSGSSSSSGSGSASNNSSNSSSGSQSSGSSSESNSGSSPGSGSASNNSSNPLSGSQSSGSSGSDSSSSGSSPSLGSSSGSSASGSPASSSAPTCGTRGGRKHHTPASGGAAYQYKRRSLYKARHFHETSKRFAPNDI